jgi:hypothetical protein
VIDPDTCSFLADHRVRGSVLVPTVLQLDVLAVAALGIGTGLRATQVRVHDPVILDGSPREVDVVEPEAMSPSDLELRSPAGTLHLAATLVMWSDGMTDALTAVATPTSEISGTPDLVYPPLFHGPAFQVIGAFGRQGDALVSRMHAGTSRLAIPGYCGAVPVAVLELVLQTCGVWELAESGRMMRPWTIDELVVPPGGAETDPTGARVVVTPRAGGSPDTRVFDATAIDVDGRVMLQLRGYRPVAMPLAPLDEVARSLRARLDRPEPAEFRTGTPPAETTPH